jgi:SAM-dependent methyltransferase
MLFFKKLLLNPTVARRITRLLIYINNLSYAYLGLFASASENGIHPKHRILKYKEWFLKNIQPDWIVLDIGCSTGLMPYLLADKAKFVYGIEINEKFIREAKEKRHKPNIEYICADATLYEFKERRVNCVILSNVLEHIENRVAFLQRLIANLQWENRDHKVFLIRVPIIDRDWLTIYKKELGLDYRLDPTHYIEYSFEELQEELNRSGIEIIHYKARFGEIYAVCRVIRTYQ